MFIESRLVVQRLCARRRFPSIAITEQHLNRVTGVEAHQVGDAVAIHVGYIGHSSE
jgi:hypothetical protein